MAAHVILHADLPLARRIEAAEAVIARDCNSPVAGGAVAEIAGGIAVFAGTQSPLTQALGVGLHGPVSAAELDRLEAFFRSRGAPVTIDLCPLTDPDVLSELAARGYRPSEFNNVLVKTLPAMSVPAAQRVRCALPGESDLWSRTVGQGFFETAALTREEMDVGRAVFAMVGAICYLASGETAEPAGGAALALHGGVAVLFADGVVPAARRRGLHVELIAARLQEASARNCEFATATTFPGGASQRNYERLGFQVAYTKVTLVR